VSAGTHVTLAREDHVGVVTLRRPEALNAFSGAVADELAAAFTHVARDDTVWAVVLAAEGDRAFCVGADLKERASFTPADFRANRVQVRRMFAALRALPQPSIAAVFGYALGGGCELALSCDLVVAADDAEIGLTEARVGLLPAGGGTQLLPRRVGVARAKELVFTGRRVGAAEALELGLVDRVVARTELESAVHALAREICSCSPVAVRAAKVAIDTAPGTPLSAGLDVEHAAWSVVIDSRDRAEGIAAFNDKRPPRWRNR
jgi:enoyl-CoA hydratase/carnithine racemase